jgi:c-di-GMP-binding flagellar brake protein YcgR
MVEIVRVTPVVPPDSLGIDNSRDSLYGLRFVMVEPKQRADLWRFIEILAQEQGTGQRKHPRVARRVELFCSSQDAFRAMLKNISRGGLAFTCTLPLVLEEKISITIRMPDGQTPLELPGTVVHVRSTPDKQFQVGLKFTALPPEKERQIEALIIGMLSGKR